MVNKTQKLTEGAILVAVYAILLLTAIYLPFLGFLAMFALALPFIIFVSKHGLRSAIMLLIVALLITYIVGSVIALPATIMFGTSGAAIGYTYYKNKPSFQILIVGSISFIVNFVILYGITVLLTGVNIIETSKEAFRNALQTSEEMLGSMGQASNEQLEVIYNMIDNMEYFIPTAMIITGVILALITQILANRVLKRLKINVPEWEPFRNWKFPKSLLWYYLLVSILVMIGLEEGSLLYIATINLFFVLEIVMAVQGLSFIFFYFNNRGASKGIPIAITIFSFLLPFLLYLIRILGIIDLGFDLRKRLKKG